LTFEMSTGSKGYHATSIQRDSHAHHEPSGQPVVGTQPSPADQRAIGTLKTIRNDMGFCSVDGVSGDVLLGRKSLQESGVDLATMQVGDTLTFEIVVGAKGYHAIDIRLPVEVEDPPRPDGAWPFRKTQTKGPKRPLRPALNN